MEPDSRNNVEAYGRDGFIVVEGVLSPAEIDDLAARSPTTSSRRRALLTAHDEVYDLEPTHTRAEPRVRRIKTPHKQHPRSTMR